MHATEVNGRQPLTDRPAWRRWAIGTLAVAAVVSLVASLAPVSYQILSRYPIIDANVVLPAVDALLPWALVAAVLYGADGWAAGRSLLWWGATALALAATLDLVLQVMFALMPETVAMSEALRLWLPIRYLAESAATSVGFGLLAAGLWNGRNLAPHGAVPGGALAIGVIGGAAIAAVVADLWAAVPIVDGLPPEYVAVGVAGGRLEAMISLALAALAIVALRITPASAGLPELLIAAGATLVMLARAGAWALPYALLSGSESVPLTSAIFFIVRGAMILGLVVMSAGFVLAWLATRVGPRPSVPEAA
jgi:hypothetical protein